MVKSLDCGIVESEFDLRSRYYVRFQTNTLGKPTFSILLQLIYYCFKMIGSYGVVLYYY